MIKFLDGVVREGAGVAEAADLLLRPVHVGAQVIAVCAKFAPSVFRFVVEVRALFQIMVCRSVQRALLSLESFEVQEQRRELGALIGRRIAAGSGHRVEAAGGH